MAPGRPRKQAHNTKGLRNKAQETSKLHSPSTKQHADPVPASENPSEDERDVGQHFDSLRFVFDDENDGDGIDDNVEELSSDDLSEWDGVELRERLYRLAAREGDDPLDEDWLPSCLERKRKRMKHERPEEYRKGPDVMSKSKRTQECYRKANRDQTKLDAFGFSKQSKCPNVEGPLSDGLTQLAEYGSKTMDDASEDRCDYSMHRHQVSVPICQESVPIDLHMSSDESETENQQLLASSDDIGHPSNNKSDEQVL